MTASPINEQDRTREHFDQHSAFWLDVYHQPHTFPGYCLLQQHHFVLTLVEQSAKVNRILDIGCGSGFTALELARKGYQVSGIDIAPQMIRLAQNQAQQQHIECDFRVGSVEDLPFPDQSIDLVIALGLMSNLREDGQAFHEMKRVLRSQGRLILSVSNRFALDLLISFPRSLPILLSASPYRRWVRTLGNGGRRLLGRETKPQSQLRFGRLETPWFYRRYLQQQGFHDVTYRALAYGPMYPLGLVNYDDERQINFSKTLEQWSQQWKLLQGMGTIMIYDGRYE